MESSPVDPMPQMSDEWMAEIQRRSAEYDAGRVRTIPWEQVRDEAFQRSGVKDAKSKS